MQKKKLFKRCDARWRTSNVNEILPVKKLVSNENIYPHNCGQMMVMPWMVSLWQNFIKSWNRRASLWMSSHKSHLMIKGDNFRLAWCVQEHRHCRLSCFLMCNLQRRRIRIFCSTRRISVPWRKMSMQPSFTTFILYEYHWSHYLLTQKIQHWGPASKAQAEAILKRNIEHRHQGCYALSSQILEPKIKTKQKFPLLRKIANYRKCRKIQSII